MLSQPSKEDLLELLFSTHVKIDLHCYKILVDSGNSVNAISQDASTKIGLESQKHPNSYHVNWVNSNSIPIYKRCLLNLKMLSYEDEL